MKNGERLGSRGYARVERCPPFIWRRSQHRELLSAEAGWLA
jgi:hypothetical protein